MNLLITQDNDKGVHEQIGFVDSKSSCPTSLCLTDQENRMERMGDCSPPAQKDDFVDNFAIMALVPSDMPRKKVVNAQYPAGCGLAQMK